MGKICEYSTAPSPPVPKVASNVDLDIQDKGSDKEEEKRIAGDPAEEAGQADAGAGAMEGASRGVSSSSSSSALVPLTMMPKHSSVMGHLVLIAQVFIAWCFHIQFFSNMT